MIGLAANIHACCWQLQWPSEPSASSAAEAAIRSCAYIACAPWRIVAAVCLGRQARDCHGCMADLYYQFTAARCAASASVYLYICRRAVTVAPPLFPSTVVQSTDIDPLCRNPLKEHRLSAAQRTEVLSWVVFKLSLSPLAVCATCSSGCNKSLRSGLMLAAGHFLTARELDRWFVKGCRRCGVPALC